MDLREVFQRIQSDPVYQRNIRWGTPRPGHPEGTIAAHIQQLEANLEKLRLKVTEKEYWKLKILIHVHDTFKAEAREGMPISDPGSHASRARTYLATLYPDPELLTIVQYHDEPLALWQKVKHRKRLDRMRLDHLLNSIHDWNVFLAFIIIDGWTEGKNSEPIVWFFNQIKGHVQTKWSKADIISVHHANEYKDTGISKSKEPLALHDC